MNRPNYKTLKMATNSISLFGASVVDGKKLIEDPSQFFRDAMASSIMYVRMVKSAWGGNPQYPCFYIAYQAPRSLTVEYFILPTHANLTTLTQFKAGLTALNTYANTFTLYTGLVKTSNQPSGFFTNLASGYLEVLINNTFTNTPLYIPKNDQTSVSVNIFNALSKFVFYFSGDQTYAGQYLYFTNTGNA